MGWAEGTGVGQEPTNICLRPMAHSTTHQGCPKAVGLEQKKGRGGRWGGHCCRGSSGIPLCP